MVENFHCIKCGRNLNGGTCRICDTPRCDKCGSVLSKKAGMPGCLNNDNGPYTRYLPYHTTDENEANITYWKCSKGCNSNRYEIIVYKNGQKFGFNGSYWEPF